LFEALSTTKVVFSGGALERGFRRVIRDVPMGSVLIQSDATTGEPMLLHLKLPLCIRNRSDAKKSWVFILDAQVCMTSLNYPGLSPRSLLTSIQIGTGAAAFMAIRILLDHGVQQDHIVFVTFLVAKGGGISVLRAAFPRVRIVCGAVDDAMKEGWLDGVEGTGGRKVWLMQPGMGQIGEFHT
jgi:uridine kinase